MLISPKSITSKLYIKSNEKREKEATEKKTALSATSETATKMGKDPEGSFPRKSDSQGTFTRNISLTLPSSLLFLLYEFEYTDML